MHCSFVRGRADRGTGKDVGSDVWDRTGDPDLRLSGSVMTDRAPESLLRLRARLPGNAGQDRGTGRQMHRRKANLCPSPRMQPPIPPK
jgi:hypothetical protein